MSFKRINIPKTWRIARKGKEKFLIKPLAVAASSMPLLTLIRDMLRIVKTRKEAKIILHDSQISVNGKIRKDEKFPVKIFDYLTIIKTNKNYQLINENKKLILKEVSSEQARKRICKVIGKKVLKGKKIQLNLDNGFSILHEGKVNVNDSLVIDLQNKQIIKHLPLKEKSSILVVYGKNAGLTGIIESLKHSSGKKLALIKTSSGEKEIPIGNIMVTE